MNKSNEIDKLATALNKAQGEMEEAGKDAKNPFFKSSYATLAAIWEACREALKNNHLSVTQTGRITEAGGMVLVTTLMHNSGQWVEGEYLINPVKNDPQAWGSAFSYSKRYSLSALLGITVGEIDDDGNAASTPEGTSVPQMAGPNKLEAGTERFVPQKVINRPFQAKGRNLIEYSIISDAGAAYTTLLKKTADEAQRAKNEGKDVELTWTKNDYGYKIVGFKVLEEVEVNF